jgi:hypothetical protein
VGGFTGAVTGFPTVVFSFAMVVVVAYWVLVLLGGAHLHTGHHAGAAGRHGGGHGTGHGGHGGRAGHGGPGHQPGGGRGGVRGGMRHIHGGLQRALGLGGVPVTVAVSLLIAFAWFGALTGQTLLDGRHGGAVLAGALVVGWAGARVLAWPLRRIMPAPAPSPSRRDFVGRACVIRTGRVGPDFGQAEVRADDGSAALVQVRQSLDEAAGPGSALSKGAAALIYDYDAEGEFFRVMPELPASG